MTVFIFMFVVLVAMLGTSRAGGQLDVTFGNRGIVLSDSASSAGAVVVLPDGRILVGGAGESGFVISRYNTDGTLDTTFGEGGKVTHGFSLRYATIRALAIQNDGKIIAAGEFWAPPAYSSLLARYTSDGILDLTFGIQGEIVMPGGFNAADLVIQPDGKIVVAEGTEAWFDCGAVPPFQIARYKVDGTLDLPFGNGGRVTSNFSGHPQVHVASGAEDVVIQSDGKIVAVGSSLWLRNIDLSDPFFFRNIRPLDFALARYNSDGTPDPNFGDGGQVMTDFLGDSIDDAIEVALQTDGKILTAGIAYPVGALTGDLALARYSINGTLDPTFGGGGRIVTANVVPISQCCARSDMAIQRDGKIVVVMGVSEQTLQKPQFNLFRYDASGKLDVTFGIGGKVSTVISDAPASASAVAIQPDGKIVVAGWARIGAKNTLVLARYNNDGSLPVTDLRFGPRCVQPGGSFTVAFSGQSLTDDTYFDLRYRMPGNDNDQVALNWQRGTWSQHDVPANTTAGVWTINGVRPHLSANGNSSDFLAVSANITVSLSAISCPNLPAVDIRFDSPSVRIGGSFTATFSGANLNGETYFDLRVRSPLEDKDRFVLNWQRGTAAVHTIGSGTAPGTWTVVGIRAHQNADDHSSDFVPVLARIAVVP